MRKIFFTITIIIVLVQMAAISELKPPEPASTKEEIEELPGLYKVAGRGGDVGNVYCVLTPEPVLIDCGSRIGWDQLVGNLKLLGLSPGDIKWVIATHGHWDHIDAMTLFQKDYPDVKFALHAGDTQFVTDDDRVFSCAEPLYTGVESGPVKVDRILLDGDTVTVGDVDFHIIHTPGHTPGSLCISTEMAGKKIIFCSDSIAGYYSLMNRSSTLDWQKSLTKLQALDIDWLYTGHGRKPVTSREEIQSMLAESMEAVTFKRNKQAEDEPYRGLLDEMKKEKQH